VLGIIIQARLGSTRLPRKVLKPFLGKKGILQIIIENIILRFNDIPIIVATTDNKNDLEIVKLCETLGVNCYRGSEHDVLNRFIRAAEVFSITKIIRICSDNPFLDLDDLSNLIIEMNKRSIDYFSYSLSDNTPVIKSHYGFWAEGVSLKALKIAAVRTNETVYLEHVTNYIYTHPEYFSIYLQKVEDSLELFEDIRLTVDTQEDFVIAQAIYSIYIECKFQNKIELLEKIQKNPRWRKSMIKQISKYSKK
jgi:spore coat polysaccharide biosynthesis protein SpsF